MERRGFVVGAGAFAVAAAAGAAGLAGCGRSAGPGQAAKPVGRTGASAAREISGTLDSRFTKARMGWTISMPGGARKPLATVFCLHGYHSDHRMAFDQVDLPQVAAGLGLPLVIAAVDGGADSYWHKRADGTDAMAMLMREFVPLVRDRVGPLPQALLGWSMGGYGALLAAERFTGQFHAVAPASPAVWLAPGDTAPGAFDSPADFYANDVFTGVGRLRPLKVAVFCGDQDPFYVATRHLVGLMRYPHEARFAPGGHDDTYWRSVAPGQLRAIAQARGIAR